LLSAVFALGQTRGDAVDHLWDVLVPNSEHDMQGCKKEKHQQGLKSVSQQKKFEIAWTSVHARRINSAVVYKET
jgi:hypothetical protein